MTRSTMRTMLRRVLNEPVEDQFTDISLNDLLHNALLLVEKEVLKVSPQEFAEWELGDITAAKDLYPLPTRFIREYRVELLDAAGKYNKLDKHEYDELVDDDLEGYALLGRYICLRPIPNTTRANGLRLVYCPVLTMAEDTDTPAIPDALHLAIVLWAKALACEETGEPTEATRQRITEMLLDLPMWWKPGTPGKITPEGV
jgi:hypothetical protein